MPSASSAESAVGAIWPASGSLAAWSHSVRGIGVGVRAGTDLGGRRPLDADQLKRADQASCEAGGAVTFDHRTMPLRAQSSQGGGVPAGPWARIVQRLLALNAAIWQNWQIGAPVKRSLIGYDH
jgi:hypothetical protein